MLLTCTNGERRGVLPQLESGFNTTSDAPQLLEYICHDFLAELETAMSRVIEELTTFREKGAQLTVIGDLRYRVSVTHDLAQTDDYDSAPDVPRGREGASDDPLRTHHDDRDVLLERHGDDASVFIRASRLSSGRGGESLLVPFSGLQCLLRC